MTTTRRRPAPPVPCLSVHCDSATRAHWSVTERDACEAIDRAATEIAAEQDAERRWERHCEEGPNGPERDEWHGAPGELSLSAW